MNFTLEQLETQFQSTFRNTLSDITELKVNHKITIQDQILEIVISNNTQRITKDQDYRIDIVINFQRIFNLKEQEKLHYGLVGKFKDLKKESNIDRLVNGILDKIKNRIPFEEILLK
jgi:hypothetical protein